MYSSGTMNSTSTCTALNSTSVMFPPCGGRAPGERAWVGRESRAGLGASRCVLRVWRCTTKLVVRVLVYAVLRGSTVRSN